MVDKPTDLVLEHLKAIQSQNAEIRSSQLSMATDIRSLKAHMAAFFIKESTTDTTIAEIQLRLERVENRLGLLGHE
jgi:hypothetical protein